MLCEDILISEKKGLDENFENFQLHICFIHSISYVPLQCHSTPQKRIKDLLDPPSDPSTTMITEQQKTQESRFEVCSFCNIDKSYV